MTETTKVEIVGEAGSAVRAMHQAAAAVKDGVEDIKGHFETLNSSFESVRNAMLEVGAVLAGGKIFKDVIEQTVEWEEGSLKLSRALGTTTEEASVYKVALERLGISSDTL